MVCGGKKRPKKNYSKYYNPKKRYSSKKILLLTKKNVKLIICYCLSCLKFVGRREGLDAGLDLGVGGFRKLSLLVNGVNHILQVFVGIC